MYKENPKTAGSGILCAIVQTGTCPNKCDDCFFQSGRSYLEPLDENLPNMPYCQSAFDGNSIVRINDGNDSNVDKLNTERAVGNYQHKFYNTAIPKLDFDSPVVLTVNPGGMTDNDFHKIDQPPNNLMFVRVRTNVWNVAETNLVDNVVAFYSQRNTPIVLTFMAYHDAKSIPESCRQFYPERKRTLNSYFAITTSHWRKIITRYENNKYVYSCGREGIASGCKFCGNCLREYFAARCRMKS